MNRIYHMFSIFILLAVGTLGIYGTINHRVGPASYYPPAGITGVVNPNVSQDNIQTTICRAGFTATIRPPSSYTSALKAKQVAEYGLQCPVGCEEDHLISLELGGSPTDPKNLWPEAYPIARQKDQTENALKAAVCANSMTLVQAQSIITTDWYAYYSKNLQGKYGVVDTVDPDDEEGGAIY